jgi:uncharacterized membrane protein YfcA
MDGRQYRFADRVLRRIFRAGCREFSGVPVCALMGYDFLNASAAAKLINTATNLSALLLFIAKGHIWWHFVVVMAVANVLGSLLGTRMALRHGTGFVRVVFLLVVSALILKTGQMPS